MKIRIILLAFTIWLGTVGFVNAFAPPTLTWQTTPLNLTADHYAIFDFNADDSAATFECALDAAAFAPCTAPVTYFKLDIGVHTFQVRTTSGSDTTTDTFDWTIESVFSGNYPNMDNHGVLPFPDNGGTRGSFRIRCDFAQAKYDDPIVFPNQPDEAHYHMFFGNMLTDADTTIESLVTTGDSTCPGSPFNRTAYWVPALLAPKFDELGQQETNSFGQPDYDVVMPTDNLNSTDVYYKTNIDDLSLVQSMPHGLRMIAGVGSATTVEDTNGSIRWHCDSWTNQCQNSIPACAVGDTVELTVFFPSCWDGINLYLPDQSHMTYPIPVLDDNDEWVHACPASHPTNFPRISMNINYGVTEALAPFGDSRLWRLASDKYTVNDTIPGGYSAHGDWMMAWNPEIMDTFIEFCLRGGKHCSNGDLGNGWRMTNITAGPGTLPPVINSGHSGILQPTAVNIENQTAANTSSPMHLAALLTLSILCAMGYRLPHHEQRPT